MTEESEIDKAEELEALAILEESGEVDTPAMRSSRRKGSQVYSIRLPLDIADRIQGLADADEVSPGQLLRSWILDRLDAERHGDSVVSATILARNNAKALLQRALELAAQDTLDMKLDAHPREAVYLGPSLRRDPDLQGRDVV